jgi:hypothetical protein
MQAYCYHRTWHDDPVVYHIILTPRTDDDAQQVLSLAAGQFIIEYYEHPNTHNPSNHPQYVLSSLPPLPPSFPTHHTPTC